MVKDVSIMVDIETLGTKPGCHILEIGACVIVGPDRVFETQIDIDSMDMDIDIDTLRWWVKTNPKRFESMLFGCVEYEVALSAFVNWCNTVNAKRYWSRGNFDYPILEAAMSKFGIEPPWRYSQVRDMRTVVPSMRVANNHRAIDDAKLQAEELLNSGWDTLA